MATDLPSGLDAEAIPGDEPSAARVFRRVNDLIGTLEVAILVVLVAVLVGGAVFQVLADWLVEQRETWPYELIRYCVFFLAMMGAALAAQRQGMFHMDLVTRVFPARLRSILRILTAVLVIAMCALVIRSGADLRRGAESLNEGFEIVSTGHGYLVLIGAFALIALHYFLHAAIEVVYLAAGRLPPEPPHGGH